MARSAEAANLLRRGYDIIKIADEMGISLPSVWQYLYREVGAGRIRKTDVLFVGIPKSVRHDLSEIIRHSMVRTYRNIVRKAKDIGIGYELVAIYLDLQNTQVLMGDMYELITITEKYFHEFIKDTLVQEYGSSEDQWWRQGIPQQIRSECAALREREL